MTILVFVQDLGQFRILPVSPAPAIFCDVGTWLLWISIILFTKFHKIPPRSHLKDSLALRPVECSSVGKQAKAGRMQNPCLSSLGYLYRAKEFKTITLFYFILLLDEKYHVKEFWPTSGVPNISNFVSHP